MNKQRLTEKDYQQAAEALGCEVASLKAVAFVEAGGDGFLPDGQAKILFERHVFSRLTNGAYDKSHPHISNPEAGGYLGGYAEHTRLDEAVKLNRSAALQAASWGKFQLLGEGYKSYCGYASIQEMVTAMYRSEQDHLWGFCNFIRAKKKLLPALRAKDWATFAYYYNGRNYAARGYHTKMAQAYQRFSR